jgi:endonuclease YncB( thermonuclease family)
MTLSDLVCCVFAILVTVFLSVEVHAATYMLLPIDEVYDGDTIKTHVHAQKMPPPLNKLSIRVRGIDTPEMPAKSYSTTGRLGRAKCDQEAITAMAARNAVAMLVRESGATRMKVSNFGWGKFGGRIVGDVKIDGTDIAEYLIAAGYAVSYDGGKKTHDWCADE